jgi:hypothetical protein
MGKALYGSDLRFPEITFGFQFFVGNRKAQILPGGDTVLEPSLKSIILLN